MSGGRAGGNGRNRARTMVAVAAGVALLVTVAGCRSHPPLPAVESVDLVRFMGDWYVIASIPTVFEAGAYNALENYRLEDDGTVATTFTYNQDSFDGPLKKYTARGFVRPGSQGAVWGMQFIWPFKAEYRIIFLTDDYAQTVIGRTKRDYVWVMARTPTIPEADYARIVALLASVGYDTAKLQRIPQRSVPRP
jgi:apolipoprotein D and lipocalin family protein